MRKKRPMAIFSFAATSQAMAMEAFCKKNHFPGRLIPLPTEIFAGCGLAWAVPIEEKNRLIDALREEEIAYQQCKEILF